ncbi:MAG: MarR family transcriptional regulator [Fimbriimonadales bacterium]|nr:MarR family transcriptional regulator [Fimbriimonadales bacterium]
MPEWGLDRVELLGDMFASFIRESLCKQVIEELKQQNISYSHYEVIRLVIARPGSTVGEIAKALNMAYPKVTQLITRLREVGLITKKGVRSDRRIARVYATSKGEELATRIGQERTKRLRAVLKRMRADERAGLASSLEEFLVAADKSGMMKNPFARVGLDPDEDPQGDRTNR